MSSLGFIFFVTTIVFLILWIKEKNNNSFMKQNMMPPPHQQPYNVPPQPPTTPVSQPQGFSPGPQPSVAPNVQPQIEGVSNPYYKGSNIPQNNYVHPNQGGVNPYYAGGQPPLQRRVRTKEEINIRNLNIILYVASFLVIAGAATLLGSMVDSVVQLAILVSIGALFYIAGIVLYVFSAKLKVAAVAFTGTGLAIIPFMGVSFYLLASIPGSVSWLITSIIGLIANIVATYVLRNQVVSYFSIAFLLSLFCSLVATSGLGITWYFVVLIIISIACTLLSKRIPSIIPSVLVKPIERTGQIVTPAAVITSVFLIDTAPILLFSLVFSLASIHYFLFYLRTKNSIYEGLVRILVQISLIIIVVNICNFGANPFDSQLFILLAKVVCVCLLVTSVLQIMYSNIKIILLANQNVYKVESAWVQAMTLFILASLLLWHLIIVNSSEYRGIFALICMGIIIAYSGFMAIYYKKMLPAYLAMILIIPMALMLFWVTMGLSEQQKLLVSFVFLIGVILLLIYYRKMKVDNILSFPIRVFLNIFILLYTVVMLITAVSSSGDYLQPDQDIINGLFFLGAACIIYVFSNIENRLIYHIASIILFVYGIETISRAVFHERLAFDGGNVSIVIEQIICLAVLGFMAYKFHKKGTFVKRNTNLICAAVLSLFPLVFLPDFARNGYTLLSVQTVAVPLVASALAFLFTCKANVYDTKLRYLLASLSIVYGVVSTIIAHAVGDVMGFIVALIVTAFVFVLSRKLRIQFFDIFVSFGIVFISYEIATLINIASNQIVFVSGIISAIAFYILYWGNLRHRPSDKLRIWYFFGVTEFALLVSFISSDIYLVETGFALAMITAFLTIGIIAFICGVMEKIVFFFKEIGLYIIVISIVLYLTILLPYADINAVYIHLLAAAPFVSAFLLQRTKTARTVRAVIALAIITVGMGLEALTGYSDYQIVFLVEMIAILIVGALNNKQWVLYWGVVGVILSVLYFLKNFVWLMLLFLGVVLIAFVIWRLVKISRRR